VTVPVRKEIKRMPLLILVSFDGRVTFQNFSLLVLYLYILLNLSCPAVSQKYKRTSLYIVVSAPVHTIESLLSCCVPEV
jgi:hypothetical protein